MAEEINFIRPQEVYDRNTGESKVRYRSYDGNDRFIPVVDGEKGVPKTMVEVTHAELKAMRDGGKLTAGALYRITDYVTTTSQENTRSAGHQFDVIVLALDGSTLSEEAWAMLHDGDEYFANSNLNGWRLLYSLDNDKERFAWADPENGKGVIYRMIDEWNNDCPYDFKNIQFKRKLTDGQYDKNGTETWCYTLNLWYNDMCQDASIVGNTLTDDEYKISGVHSNSFGYTSFDYPIEEPNIFTFALNDNVILSIIEDSYYYGIYDNNFGEYFNNNTIGSGCDSNIIGNHFNGNIIRNGFRNNSIGNYFIGNSIGDGFEGNVIGGSFNSNNINGIFIGNFVANSFEDITISSVTRGKNYGNNGVELATKDDIGDIETALSNI